MKRITVDLTKASTETLDLTDKLNPRVGDSQLAVPLHVIYGTDDSGNEEPVDMRNKDIEFLSQDTNKNDIYVSDTVTTDSKGDDPYSGNVTFVFPEGTFKVAGTYDVDKTMFRIINKADKTVLSTVNVKLNVLEGGGSDYNFDPNKTSYNSRLEDMLKLAQSQMKDKITNADQEAQAALNDAKQKAASIIKDASDQAQSLLDDIKQTNDEAKGNVAGDTAATAKQAKQQANDNAGKVHDLQGEVGDARGRFMTLSDRENKQDFNIDRKEEKANANDHYAAINLRDDQQDLAIAEKASLSFIISYFSKMKLQPEAFENVDALKAKYPSGAAGFMITVDTGHKWVYWNNTWVDCGIYQAAGIADDYRKIINQPSPDNLVDNSDLRTSEYWTLPDGWHIDSDNQINNSNAISIARTGLTDISLTYASSNKIAVGNHKVASFAWQAKTKYIDGNAWVELSGYDSNDQRTLGKQVFIGGDNFELYSAENIAIPDGTDYLITRVVINKNGEVIAARPQVNFGEQLIPYSSGITAEYRQLLSQTNIDNLIPNSDFKNREFWTTSGNWQIDTSNSINGSNLFEVEQQGLTDFSYASLGSCKIATGKHKQFSFGWKAKADGLVYDKPDNAGGAWIEVMGYDKDGKQTLSQSVYIKNNPDEPELRQYKSENIEIPDGTDYLITRAVLQKNGKLIVAQPQINFGERLLEYSIKSVSSRLENLRNSFNLAQSAYTNNILSGYPITDLDFWSPAPYSDQNVSLDTEHQYRGLPTIRLHNQGATSSDFLVYTSKRFAVSESTVSLQVPFMISELGDNDTGYLEMVQYDSLTGKALSTQDYYPTQVNEFYLFTLNNIELAKETKYLQLRFVLQKNGAINIGNVALYYGDKCGYYSSAQIVEADTNIKQMLEASTKNALTQTFTQHHYVSGDKAAINYSSFDEGNYTLEINVPDSVDTSWTTVDSEYIKTHGNVMSYSVRAKTANADAAAIVNLREFASVNDTTPLQATTLYVGGPTYSKQYQKFFKENIVLNEKTNYVVVRYTMQKHGDTHFADPVLNWSASLYAHDFGELSNQMRLPQLHLNSTIQINNDWSATSFSYRDGERLINGFMQIAWQGDSSRLYPKKNFKIKLFSDAECKNKLKIKPKSDWQANNKFNLKANWIDATQARNLVNAKLFAQATAVTPFADPKVAAKLSATQNFGQMEGFPIEVYGTGGQYLGLYTFNTKKDEKTFGMDSKDATNEAITCEGVSSTFNDVTKTIDGETYATVVQDTASDELKANFTKFLQFLNTSTDDDFKAHLGDYIDVKSVINTYLWGFMSQMWDFDAKSMILLTWNSGKSFYMIPYDMDSTWGLHFDGAYIKDEDGWKFSPDATRLVSTNALYKRLHKLFLNEIKDQYHYLRTTVWNNSQLITAFKRYIDNIPKEVYEREQALWPAIPSKDITNFSQIQSNIIKRMNAMDIFMK